MPDYSSQRITKELLDEVRGALKNVKGWGSVEIFVQDGKVVQITERNIKKTNHVLPKFNGDRGLTNVAK